MEQPTIFYAIALTLALMDHGDGINLILAWGYIVLRMVHSLVQAITHVARIRYFPFLTASACLLVSPFTRALSAQRLMGGRLYRVN